MFEQPGQPILDRPFPGRVQGYAVPHGHGREVSDHGDELLVLVPETNDSSKADDPQEFLFKENGRCRLELVVVQPCTLAPHLILVHNEFRRCSVTHDAFTELEGQPFAAFCPVSGCQMKLFLSGIVQVDFDFVDHEQFLGEPDDRGHKIVKGQLRIHLLHGIGNPHDIVEVALEIVLDLTEITFQEPLVGLQLGNLPQQGSLLYTVIVLHGL